MKIKFSFKNKVLHTVQICLIFCGCGMFLFFITPYILFNILNAGNMIGMSLSALICAAGVLLPSIQIFILRLYHKKNGRIACYAILCTAAAALFSVVLSTFFMAFGYSQKADSDSTVIVLGCQVIGNKPGVMLQERIYAAYDYLSANPKASAILSGGKGCDELISEAECMFQNLVNMGIAPNRLLKEDKSTSTRENIVFSNKIIRENNFSEKITIITNDFHCFRACHIAKNEGLCAGAYRAKTHWYLFPTFYLREICAIIAQNWHFRAM